MLDVRCEMLDVSEGGESGRSFHMVAALTPALSQRERGQEKTFSRRHEQGGVLIVVLVMLVVLASLVLLMARSMRTEAAASANEAARLRASGVAEGAVVYVRSLLVNSNGVMPKDSEIQREAVKVGDGYFWLLKHDKTQSTVSTQTFGLTDEAGKLDINRAGQDALSRLPGMTADLADAIVDWRDVDDDASPGGAESGYYLALAKPYSTKNEPFESLEELLMVKGFTRGTLYGGDKNRNLMMDAGESGGTTVTGGTSSVQIASPANGVADYLTLYSIPAETTASTSTTTQRMVNVNLQSAERTALIIEAVGSDRAGAVLQRIRRGGMRNILDFYLLSGMSLDEFKRISDRVTTTTVPASGVVATPRGLVNLNSAPKEVLMALGDLTEADAQAIVGRQGDGTGFANLVDILDVVPAERAVSVGSMVGVKPGAVSADIVAVDGTGRGFKRLQVVMNMSGTVLFVRDATGLGWPIDAGILASLRAGQGPSGSAGTAGSGAAGNGMTKVSMIDQKGNR
jgi:type II secretory pathway component PulK